MRRAQVLPFSAACERNKEPILAVLRSAFADAQAVLEIGSGTGQHAVHFSRALPHLHWQASELPGQLAALAQRLALEGPPGLAAPIALDVESLPWTLPRAFDALFTANTLHIVRWEAVQALLRGAGAALAAGGTLCVYGPFRYRGAHTSASNEAFDASLRARDRHSGIRDFEAVDALARAQGFVLQADHAMPANNRALVWRRPRE